MVNNLLKVNKKSVRKVSETTFFIKIFFKIN